ncbi:hypothetical protein DLAC_05154 [Tieghemostelium lacteum]|uniref:Uncharacterized protein n=1 Tax=Tieghemostelium lacteum TaxID=361077 RepID=A0A151ZIT6_TIELA|nr:hypothetical protein DLAC_05154 [Tieghemostelium lacteum]|eukprot:KYQ93764.1 hypothetical protein DLAC_05154 [Tieghemostelium lacteum]
MNNNSYSDDNRLMIDNKLKFKSEYLHLLSSCNKVKIIVEQYDDSLSDSIEQLEQYNLSLKTRNCSKINLTQCFGNVSYTAQEFTEIVNRYNVKKWKTNRHKGVIEKEFLLNSGVSICNSLVRFALQSKTPLVQLEYDCVLRYCPSLESIFILTCDDYSTIEPSPYLSLFTRDLIEHKSLKKFDVYIGRFKGDSYQSLVNLLNNNTVLHHLKCQCQEDPMMDNCKRITNTTLKTIKITRFDVYKMWGVVSGIEEFIYPRPWNGAYKSILKYHKNLTTLDYKIYNYIEGEVIPYGPLCRMIEELPKLKELNLTILLPMEKEEYLPILNAISESKSLTKLILDSVTINFKCEILDRKHSNLSHLVIVMRTQEIPESLQKSLLNNNIITHLSLVFMVSSLDPEHHVLNKILEIPNLKYLNINYDSRKPQFPVFTSDLLKYHIEHHPNPLYADTIHTNNPNDNLWILFKNLIINSKYK